MIRFALAVLLSLSFIIQGIYYAGSPSKPFGFRLLSKFFFNLGQEYGFWLISTPFLVLGVAIPYIVLFRAPESKDTSEDDE